MQNRISGNSLFMDNEEQVEMPRSEINNVNEPVGIGDVAKIISGDTVERTVIPESPEDGVDEHNYLLDLSNLNSWTYMEKQSIKSLISKHGDTSIYLRTKKIQLVCLGKGKRELLDFILPEIKSAVFGDKINIYKDFSVNEELREISTLDFTDFRLDL